MTFFKKIFVTDPEIQMQRLEMKVNALMVICVVQALMVAALLFAEMFIPSTFTMLVLLVIVGGGLYLFRQQLPSVIRSVLRLLNRRDQPGDGESGDTKFR
jgi:hypothetical protein